MGLIGVHAADQEIYLKGEWNSWQDSHKFTNVGDEYSIHLDELNGKFKIATADWSTVDLGASDVTDIKYAGNYATRQRGGNFTAYNLTNVDIKFTLVHPGEEPIISISCDQIGGGEIDPPLPGDWSISDVYLRGVQNGWTLVNPFLCRDNEYKITLDALDGDFKIATEDWSTVDFGASSAEMSIISGAGEYVLKTRGDNFTAKSLTNVELSFIMSDSNPILTVKCDQIADPIYPDYGERSDLEPTGTLPVLYIQTDDIMRSRNLRDKDYRDGTYWLDPKGTDYAAIGSEEAPLPLTIKARGNYTRTAYSKKPFKLKLEKKQKLCGLSNSKHFALLAHADDDKGFLRNFVGFSLGKRIGLPWAPGEVAIELVINGDYRGIYFLTESIRIDSKRVDIVELNDEVTDPALCSGGYLVELDNYEDEGQIVMPEAGNPYGTLRVTPDTPEVYSPVQRRFVTEQFTDMNDLIGNYSSDIWSYLDLDDAARYYIVEETIDHWESYHGSTYLYRDFGDDQKWHFSPLWDCGNAFSTMDCESYFTTRAMFGNTWINQMRHIPGFMDKVKDTWKWFTSSCVSDIYEEIDARTAAIKDAAMRDHQRWINAPVPDPYEAQLSPQRVKTNDDLESDAEYVKAVLRKKINWLKSIWGGEAGEEPAYDTTPAARLPWYVAPQYRDSYVVYYISEGAENPRLTLKYDGHVEILNYTAPSVSRIQSREATSAFYKWEIPTADKDVRNATVSFSAQDPIHQTEDQKLVHSALYRPGMELMEGFNEDITTVVLNPSDVDLKIVEYKDLLGRTIVNPVSGTICIAVYSNGKVEKVIVK